VKSTSKTIYIRWVRSGIGFTHRQKRMVRSLGLRRLQQVVEAPDTPSIRGLINKISHLVEIVSPETRPDWLLTEEYSIRERQAPVPAPEAGPGKPRESSGARERVVEAVSGEEGGVSSAPSAPTLHPDVGEE
jgi:large subunit ribosomal protein L30